MVLGIDMGTAWARLVKKNQGLVLEEPALVALDRNSQQILAVGRQANQVLGKSTGAVVALAAYRGGVISDLRATFEVLRKCLKGAGGRLPVKPVLQLSVATTATVIQRRSLIEVALQAGAKEARLIASPLAAARGGGLETSIPRGRLIVDLGGGLTQAAVLSMDAVILSESEPCGGAALDDLIQRHVRQVHGVLIGVGASEELKRNQLNLQPGSLETPDRIEVAGLGLVDGLPKAVELSQAEMLQALLPHLQLILGLIRRTLMQTPPELAADIYEDGLSLVGGGAQLHGLAQMLSATLGLAVRTLPQPQHCAALGLLDA